MFNLEDFGDAGAKVIEEKDEEMIKIFQDEQCHDFDLHISTIEDGVMSGFTEYKHPVDIRGEKIAVITTKDGGQARLICPKNKKLIFKP